jgi:hypothetical protein
VAEGIGQDSPWAQVQGQVLLGSERFVERLCLGLQEKRSLNGYSLSDIGRVSDLHYSTISRIASAQDRQNA